MANRSVSVRLDALVAPYVAGMGQASAATTAFARTTDTQLTKSTTSANKLGQATGLLPGKFGALASVGGAAFAGLGLAIVGSVKTFADFDKQMSAVGAATGATGKELEMLGETAITSAASTKFGATEAAAGIESLAKAGVSTADIMGGALKGSLDLAAAGELEVAEAAELAASALTQFNLAGSDVSHVADLFAAGAGKAQGSVQDMGMAFQQSGLVASQMGLSIEETTGTLASFASAGLIGSDAGTSFRTMLLRLANPTGEAAELMEQLGIQAYNAQGQFVGIEGLAGQLQTRLAGLSQEQRNAALATIFGSDAIRGASVLYAQGAEGVADWTEKVDDSGFAAEQAAKRTDNLAGDLERLGGQVEALGIKLGGTADGPVRDFVQWLETLGGEINEEIEIWKSLGDSWGTEVIEKAIGDVDQFAESIERTHDPIRAAEAATARLTGQAEAYADQTGTTTGAIQTQIEMMAELRDEALKTANQFLGLRDAEVGVEQAIDDVTTSFEENGETLDINTQAGRDNRTALDNQADAALRLMEQMYDTGASEDEVTEKAGQLREGLAQSGRRFGLTQDQAYAYADQILKIPTKRTTTPTFADANARAKVAAFQKLIQGIDQTVGVRINVSTGGMGGLGGFFTGVAPGGMPWAGRYPVTQGPHDGGAIDYGMPVGVPLRATFPGFVDFSDAGGSSYGKYYVLRGGGKYELLAHMSGFARRDGLVGTGALLGWSGNTGNSTGPHAHLLRNFAKGGPIGGIPGASVPINAHGGEYIVNAAATARNRATLEAINSGTSGRIVLEVHSGGSRYDDFLAGEVRRFVRVNGGNVQTVLGAS